MFIGTLQRQSNRATWEESVELYDDDDGTPFNISTATEIVLEVKDCNTAVLTAKLSSGTIIRGGTGIFSWAFTPTQMSTLCARTYDIGITITAADGTVTQVVVAKLPIIEGIVT